MITKEELAELQMHAKNIERVGANGPGRHGMRFTAAFRRIANRLLSEIPDSFQQIYVRTLKQKSSIPLPIVTRPVRKAVHDLPLMKALRSVGDLESVEQEIST